METELLKKYIGEIIKKHRKYKRLTQKELAQLSGTSHSQISLFENGINLPSIAILEKIFTHLDIKQDVLIIELKQIPITINRPKRRTAKNYSSPNKASSVIDNDDSTGDTVVYNNMPITNPPPIPPKKPK